MHTGDTRMYNGLHNTTLDELTGEDLPRLRDLAIDPALQSFNLGGAPSDSKVSPRLQHPTHKEKLQQLDPSLVFALEAYPEHAFQVPFMDDIRFWLDDDGPACAPNSPAPPTAPSASSSALHQQALATEGPTDFEVTLGSASASSQPVQTPRTRRERTPGPFIDSDHPRATTGPHPVTESNLLSPALDLESTKAPLFAPQRPSKKKIRSALRRAQGPTPGVAKRTRHDGTLVPAYPCARCVEKDLECLICYVGGACNTCRAVARKCDLVDQQNKYDGSISRKRKTLPVERS